MNILCFQKAARCCSMLLAGVKTVVVEVSVVCFVGTSAGFREEEKVVYGWSRLIKQGGYSNMLLLVVSIGRQLSSVVVVVGVTASPACKLSLCTRELRRVLGISSKLIYYPSLRPPGHPNSLPKLSKCAQPSHWLKGRSPLSLPVHRSSPKGLSRTPALLV